MKYPIPVLEFTDDHGLTGTFATFRLGRKLSKLPRNTSVLLVHKGHAIGSAAVVKTAIGPAYRILVDHALDSHLERDGDGDRENAAQRRFDSLQRLYGPRVFSEDKTLTVIYLRRRS